MRWRTQLRIALASVPTGLLLWFGGLGLGLGAGSSLNPHDDGIMPLAELAFICGPIIVLVGVVWLIVLAIVRLRNPIQDN